MDAQRIALGLFKRMPRAVMRMMAGAPLEVDGFRLDPNIQMLTKQEGPDLTTMSVEEARQIAHGMFATLNAARWKGVEVSDELLPGGPAGPMPVRHYFPRGLARPAPVILFFHQGGMVLLDLDTCDTFCTMLAKICNAHVISLHYRLAPEHIFPAAVEDAEALWNYVVAEAETLGADTSRLGLVGDSAGGLMVASLAQILRDKNCAVRPKAQLMVYPWVTTQEETSGSMVSCAESFPLNRQMMEWFQGHVFPQDELRSHPHANPLQNNLADLPPAIVATAGFDPLRDQGKAYAEGLTQAGGEARYHCFGSLSHSFLAFGQVSKAAERASQQLVTELHDLLQA